MQGKDILARYQPTGALTYSHCVLALFLLYKLGAEFAFRTRMDFIVWFSLACYLMYSVTAGRSFIIYVYQDSHSSVLDRLGPFAYMS